MDQFRGVRADNGEYIYGVPTRFKKGSLIVPGICVEHESDSGDWVEYVELVGGSIVRATGLECNGVMLYIGDRVGISMTGFEGVICQDASGTFLVRNSADIDIELETYTAYWGMEVVRG